VRGGRPGFGQLARSNRAEPWFRTGTQCCLLWRLSRDAARASIAARISASVARNPALRSRSLVDLNGDP